LLKQIKKKKKNVLNSTLKLSIFQVKYEIGKIDKNILIAN